MTKVRIRQVLSRTRWQLVTFCGPAGGESIGVLDLLAIRKDHLKRYPGMKRGDALQVVLIQVKGGRAAMPTPEDRNRLRAVAKRYHAREVLLATWTKGKAAQFYCLRPNPAGGRSNWTAIPELEAVFR